MEVKKICHLLIIELVIYWVIEKKWKFKELKIVNNDDMNNWRRSRRTVYNTNRKFHVLCTTPAR